MKRSDMTMKEWADGVEARLEARVRKLEEKNFAELPTYWLVEDSVENEDGIWMRTLYKKDDKKLEYVSFLKLPMGQEAKLRKIKNILES